MVVVFFGGLTHFTHKYQGFIKVPAYKNSFQAATSIHPFDLPLRNQRMQSNNVRVRQRRVSGTTRFAFQFMQFKHLKALLSSLAPKGEPPGRNIMILLSSLCRHFTITDLSWPP